jgi:preprotein translocase subunit SecF
MSFLGAARYFLAISVILMMASFVLLITPGLPLSIEFTGGTLIELRLPEGKGKDDLRQALRSASLPGRSLETASVSQTKTGTFFVRTANLSNDEHLALTAHLQKVVGATEELQFTTIGPTVGQTLKHRAIWALGLATIAIVLYLALAFRKVPRRLSPWRFGIIAVAALLHDILITVGIFAILGLFTTFQVDTLFVTALLSIMGYSVNDTIVIFDRIRDNLFLQGNIGNFADLAEQSLRQTMTRTINTGAGALIMLFVLYFLGSESIRWFILTLIIGTIIGTYSSFFIATPLLVHWRKHV